MFRSQYWSPIVLTRKGNFETPCDEEYIRRGGGRGRGPIRRRYPSDLGGTFVRTFYPHLYNLIIVFVLL